MMRFAFVFKKTFLAAILLFLFTGCGGGDTGDGFSGERGQVSGTITLDGQPLEEGCQVIFIAQEGSYTAGGLVQADGKYTLTYSDPNGLPTGIYEVQLTAPIEPQSDAPADPTKMAESIQLGPKKVSGAANHDPFPSKYASATTSMLKFDVKPGENTADFKLEKD
ncbi:MAG: carboxypeptidase-like regulatory domain-containing protein [Planctomycetota bacterium]